MKEGTAGQKRRSKKWGVRRSKRWFPGVWGVEEVRVAQTALFKVFLGKVPAWFGNTP